MSKLMKISREVYNCFTDRDGHITEQPTGSIARMKLPEDNVRFLRCYLEFLLGSKVLNEAARIYIASNYASIKSTFAGWNNDHPDKALNVKTAISNLDYSRRKLLTLFDEDMLANVIYHSHKADMTRYWEQLRSASDRYSKASALGNCLMIKTPTAVSSKAVEQSDIEDFMAAVAPYRLSTKKKVESAIEDAYAPVMGYINYLSTLLERTPEQEAVWQQVSSFLDGVEPEQEVKALGIFDDIEIDF